MSAFPSLDPPATAGSRGRPAPGCALSLEARLRLFGDGAVLTPEEFAAMRGCAARTLERERASGRGAPFIRLSRKRVGYLYGDCRQFLNRRRVGAVEDAAP